MNNPNLMYKHDADNPYPMFGLQCKYNQTSSCYPFIKYHCFSSIHKSFGRKKNYKLCIQIGNTPNYHGNPWLLRGSILLPDSIIPSQSPRYQRYQKSPKKEAHQSLRWTPPSPKCLDFKPFLYTFVKSFKIPMASTIESSLRDYSIVMNYL